MNTRKITKVYALGATLLAAVVTLIRTLCLFNSYDAHLGYFDNSPLNVIKVLLIVLSVAACFSIFLIVPRDKATTTLIPGTAAFKFASACAAIITIPVIFIIALSSPANPLEGAVFALAIASAAFFILNAVAKKVSESSRTFLSIACIALYVALLASLYFNMGIAMNSPHKVYGGLALMSSMSFMLFEVRIFIGKALPRLHLAFSALTFILGASQSASALIYVIAAKPSAFEANPVLLGNIGYIIIIAAVSIFACARCFCFDQATSDASDEKSTEDRPTEA